MVGLAVSVGILADLSENDPESMEWFEESFAAVNELLEEEGLPEHHEPCELPPLQSRASLVSLPYSFIHYLRRAYAHRVASPSWIATPLEKGEDPGADSVLEDETFNFESHLLCHSDAEGYYLPIDFEEVLYVDEDETRIPGGMVGSSYRLMEELVKVAPALGITLTNGQLSDVEAKRIDDRACSDEGLYRELSSWILLYESARLSIQHKTAIVFM